MHFHRHGYKHSHVSSFYMWATLHGSVRRAQLKCPWAYVYLTLYFDEMLVWHYRVRRVSRVSRSVHSKACVYNINKMYVIVDCVALPHPPFTWYYAQVELCKKCQRLPWRKKGTPPTTRLLLSSTLSGQSILVWLKAWLKGRPHIYTILDGIHENVCVHTRCGTHLLFEFLSYFAIYLMLYCIKHSMNRIYTWFSRI